MSDTNPQLVVAGGTNTVRIDGLRLATNPAGGPYIDNATATVTVKRLDGTIIDGPRSVPAVGSGGNYAVDLPSSVPFVSGELYDVFIEATQGGSKWPYRQRVRATDTPPPTP